MNSQPGAVRRLLDAIYYGSALLAAFFLVGICVLMLVQVAGREMGILVRGADDLTAWFCAASAFLALAHTFKRGELVRVGLWLDKMSSGTRWVAEVFSLLVAAIFVGYMTWSVAVFVWESFKFNEIAQGLILIPIWIPQSSFALGSLVLFIAIVDELVAVLRHQTPAYQLAEDERRASGDFSESV